MASSKPAKTEQEKKFVERKNAFKKVVEVCGKDFIALQKVYDTSTDTELMVDSISINPKQTFVEIGCGTGAVSLLVAKHAKSGIGVDINKEAVKNAKLNKNKLGVKNVSFKLSDVFDNVKGTFDIAICNPPYSPFKPKSTMEMMFWDEDNKMKRNFFGQVGRYLKPGGKVYFGWADFADIDQEFPLKQAKLVGLEFVRRYDRVHKEGNRNFYVYEFKSKR